MMNATHKNRTATPCKTAFCAGAFRVALAVLADTAFAVSAFVLLYLYLQNLSVLVGVGILVIAPVYIVRMILIPGGYSRRKRFLY